MTPTIANAPAPRIEVVDLVKSYRRENGQTITPVDHIDLSVAQNELVVLLGPSGCGKTTLLRCVAGLERPDSGEIVIDGKVVFSSRKGIYEPPDHRALAMVFQSYALWPHMTVAQNVAFPLESRKVGNSDIARRVSAALDMVGVSGLEQQYPGRISGGQQQRVALARALVTNSSVVLFDEPLSNVDAQVRAKLRFELQSMQRRLRFSGLYVTHDQAEAMELGQRVAVLDNGKISSLGTPWEIYDRPGNEYVAKFLGVANLWRGKVVAVSNHAVTVETGLGRLRVSQEGGAAVQGAAVSVVARPEKLRLEAGHPADDVNAVEVAIEAVLFSGAHTEIVCRAAVGADSDEILVWTGEHAFARQLATQGRAWLTMPPADLRLVPAGQESRA